MSMQSDDIREEIFKAINVLVKDSLSKMDYLFLVEGVIENKDDFNRVYSFSYNGESHTAVSLTGEDFAKGDSVYVLFSNDRDIKKMIVGKRNRYASWSPTDQMSVIEGVDSISVGAGGIQSDGVIIDKNGREVSGVKTIPGNDLNNAMAPGFYHWTTGVTNSPVDYGSMVVTAWDGTGLGQTAEQFVMKNGVMWIRGRNNAAGSWSAWAVVSKNGHAHAASDITSGTIDASRLPTRTWGDITGRPYMFDNAKYLGTDNLNSIQTPGVYYQSANANTSSARNYPFNFAGTLVVTTAAGVIQEYTGYGEYSDRKYVRGYYNGAWSTWSMILTIDRIYPVGSIYMSTSPTSPNTLFGGTWERYSQGRVLVGVDEGQTGFNAPGKTGGHYEIQAHSHTASTSVASGGAHTHTVSGTAASAGAHTHTTSGVVNSGGTGTATRLPQGNYYGYGYGTNMPTNSTGAHTHTVSGTAASAGGHTHTATTTVASHGGGNAGNLQPFITVYMFRRIK